MRRLLGELDRKPTEIGVSIGRIVHRLPGHRLAAFGRMGHHRDFGCQEHERVTSHPTADSQWRFVEKSGANGLGHHDSAHGRVNVTRETSTPNVKRGDSQCQLFWITGFRRPLGTRALASDCSGETGRTWRVRPSRAAPPVRHAFQTRWPLPSFSRPAGTRALPSQACDRYGVGPASEFASAANRPIFATWNSIRKAACPFRRS